MTEEVYFVVLVLTIIILIVFFYLQFTQNYSEQFVNPFGETVSSEQPGDSISGYPFFDFPMYIKNVYTGLIVPYNATEVLVKQELPPANSDITNKIDKYIATYNGVSLNSNGFQLIPPVITQEATFFVSSEQTDSNPDKDNSTFLTQLFVNALNGGNSSYFFSVTDFGTPTTNNAGNGNGSTFSVPFFIYESNNNYVKAIDVDFIIGKSEVTINRISVPNDFHSKGNLIKPAIEPFYDNQVFKIHNKYGLQFPFPDDSSIMYISQESYDSQLKNIKKKYGE